MKLVKENISTKIDFKSDSFKKYFKNTSWLFIEKIIRVIIGAFVVIAITNYLGPSDFGLYSYALSFAGIFTIIATLGIDSILSRELITNPDKKNTLLGTGFGLKLIGTFISIALLSITIIFTNQDRFTNLLIFIIALSPIFQSFNVVDVFFQSKVLAKYSVIAKSSSFIISSIIKLSLIIFNASLISFVIFTTAEYAFLAIAYLVMYKNRKFNIFKWNFEKKVAIEILNDSWPLILSGIVITIYMKIDQIMIKQMLGDAEVGYYAAAVRLCEAWYFLPTIITTSLFPAIMNAKKMNKELYFSRMQKLYDMLAWTSIAIALPTTFLSKEIIEILYKPEFIPAAPVLIIYIWAGVAVFLGVASTQYLIAENFTKISFFITSSAMVINVILNFIFIPKYGITGAAFATLISYSASTFLLFFNSKTKTQAIMMFKSILFFDLIKLLNKKK
ncbi:MAG: flippase [Bacteroidetes bacterium]|nr:flippase [Bacteroidota bacterium]